MGDAMRVPTTADTDELRRIEVVVAKEKSPAFQWYPKDYLSDIRVMALSWQQRGVYTHLFSMCWLEGSLPNDAAKIAKAIGAELDDVKAVLELFIPSRGNKLKHKRLETERRGQNKRRKDKSRAGKLGAKARWQRHRTAIDLPMAKDSSSSASASATASQKKERDSLAQLVDGDSAKQGGDDREPDNGGNQPTVAGGLTGGGSQAEAGPPPHGSGQPSTGKSTREADADNGPKGSESPAGTGFISGHIGEPSAEAAPLHGAGGLATQGKGVSKNVSPNQFNPGPAPTPTGDQLFNRLHARFVSKRIGGSCKNVDHAHQQFMSMREALILKSCWNPRTFEASWIKNGWDAAFAAGRQAGELEYWLRDYDPDGTVGKWEKRGDVDKPRRARDDEFARLPTHEKCGKPQGTCECFDNKPEVARKAKSEKWQRENL